MQQPAPSAPLLGPLRPARPTTQYQYPLPPTRQRTSCFSNRHRGAQQSTIKTATRAGWTEADGSAGTSLGAAPVHVAAVGMLPACSSACNQILPDTAPDKPVHFFSNVLKPARTWHQAFCTSHVSLHPQHGPIMGGAEGMVPSSSSLQDIAEEPRCCLLSLLQTHLAGKETSLVHAVLCMHGGAARAAHMKSVQSHIRGAFPPQKGL